MRRIALLALCLASTLLSGCDPNSRFNVNRGDYHDEWDAPGQDGRAGQGLDHEDVDGLDKWLHSPKERAINRDLGID
ncbi:MAG TPA: hypothetical protein VKU82_13290 [Planctomycetaceae bacterium]|nr:hypothetical protein [Planctomycetaceae bacterium]